MRHSIPPALLAALALSAPAAAAGTPVVLLSATGANVSEGELSSVSARLQVGYFVDAFPIRAPDTGKDVYVRGAIASLVLVAAPRG